MKYKNNGIFSVARVRHKHNITVSVNLFTNLMGQVLIVPSYLHSTVTTPVTCEWKAVYISVLN